MGAYRPGPIRTKMSVGPFLACGAASVKAAANPRPRGMPASPLVLAHVVVGGQRRGPQVGRAGDMGLPPGPAAILGVGESHIGGQGGIAWPVVAQVIPGHPDGAVGVDRDRRLERNPRTPGRVVLIQVRPPSLELRMPTAPEVGERLSSKVM